MAIDIESESARTYLTLLQGVVISRMASNSTSCKTWCVTIVSAVFALALDKNKPQAVLVGFLPVVLFFLLDAYYLSLEKDFRTMYTNFILKLQNGTAGTADIYVLNPQGGITHRAGALLSAIFSLAVIPFYGALAAAMLVTKHMIM